MDLRPGTGALRPRGAGTLARKYSVFTAVLVGWVSSIYFAYDLSHNQFDLYKLGILVIVVAVVSFAVSKYTTHLLGKPLAHLQKGITQVREGKLDLIQVSRTGDEIEFLGESLNAMIETLKNSRHEVREYQERLEEKIRERTEQLEEAMQKALAASRAKSEFLANISHELRTPMNGVIGMIEILLEESPSPQQADHLETARGCANTLLSLLNDILDLSKIEAGRMLLENIPFEVRPLVEDCVRSMQARARQKGIPLRCQIAPNVPSRIVGDPLRIRQMLNNLLSNAVKFTERGSVDVSVNARYNLDLTEARITLEVADTGTGIPAEKLSAIFDEFTQADGSISRRYGGTGLGLAITRRLVEMHKGRITVQSEERKGSRFRIELPARVAASAAKDAHPQPELPAAAGSTGSVPLPARILLAEDNLVNQKVVTAILKKRGYRVEVAADGREALRRLEQYPFDLVLMDVQMPELDGIEAARQIRQKERFRRLPIVAMTAHAMNGDRERCLSAGMDDYLSKPVAPAHLLEAVQKHLQRAAEEAAVTPRPLKPAPVPDHPAIERTDADLLAGMASLFVQLAPERIQKLHSAAVRMDVAQLCNLAQKLERSAERIAAFDVARRAAELSGAAATENYAIIQDRLARLEREIENLHAPQTVPVEPTSLQAAS